MNQKDMDNLERQFELYSCSKAAKMMKIGKDTLKKLIAEGKIGTIRIGRRRKITYAELLRFQSETLERKENVSIGSADSKELWSKFFQNKKEDKKQMDSKALLDKIMRS